MGDELPRGWGWNHSAYPKPGHASHFRERLGLGVGGSNPENQQVAAELAEYLIDDEFINEWTPETGYLPTRISQDSEGDIVLESAQAIPSNDVLAVLGPLMQGALTRVLNGEQVQAVVRSVMEQVK